MARGPVTGQDRREWIRRGGAAALMRAPYRVVAITGASSGLGAALARAYAAPDSVLGLVARDRDRLARTEAACRAAGARVESAALDVADAAALADWLQAFDRINTVELLIANAGISAGPDPDSPGEPASTTVRQIAVNLVGAVNTIAPLLPSLCARRRGRVVAIASVAALRGLPYSPGYCASKAGLRAYAEALRPRLARYGVGVTVVSPGFFASPMTERWDGPTPFLVSGERAARRIKRGIDRGAARIAFPWPLVLGMRLCDLAPAPIGDAILRRFRFRIRGA
jgi:short-subunit dehydrogenase